MGVDADQVAAGSRRPHLADRARAARPSSSPKPNFESRLPGLHVGVRGRLDPGGDPDQDRPAARSSSASEPLDLVERVERPGSRRPRRTRSEARPRSCCSRACRCAAGSNARAAAPCAARRRRRRQPTAPPRRRAGRSAVMGAALLAYRTSKSWVREAKGVEVAARPGANVLLGVDVDRRSELGGDLHHVAAAHLEMAALVDPAAQRVQRVSPRRSTSRLLRSSTALFRR